MKVIKKSKGKAVIVLPTYNEAGNIKAIIDQIIKISQLVENWNIQILVVDDHSPDKTAQIVEKLKETRPQLYLITGKKQGLGKAYVRGFEYAINKMKAALVFEMDADLSHPAKLIPKMLKAVDNGADFVIGARYIKGGAIPKDWGLHRKIFSYFGNLIIRLGFMNFKIHDWTSGFRAIKTDFIQSILPVMNKYSGYVFQIALLDNAIKKDLTIKEVPLRFKDRQKGISKINSLEFILYVFAYIFQNSSFAKYVVVGFTGAAIDFMAAYIFINRFFIYKPLANALSAELAIIFNFFANNFWSFAYKQIQGGWTVWLVKFLLFNLVAFGAVIIQFVGMYLALEWFGDTTLNILGYSIQSWLIYKVFIIGFLVIPYSYFMYNRVVWKK